MISKKNKGDKGELYAIKYLQSSWYKIIDTNFKYSIFWEIDIIALEDWIYCFIEVKYRTNTKFWLPEESITKSKLSKLRKTIEYYVIKNWIDFEKIRFDIITILQEWREYKLNHYKNLEI